MGKLYDVVILGAGPGGLAAGLGSFFFDLVFWGGNPVGWCVTFATKFLMGYFAGLFYHHETFAHLGRTANIAVCGAIGELAYIIGYLLKEFQMIPDKRNILQKYSLSGLWCLRSHQTCCSFCQSSEPSRLPGYKCNL